MNKKPRVLCVDDEAQVLEGLQLRLRKEFEIVTATSGQQGLDRLESEGPFATVVSDMRMPEMNGATFLTRVRERWPDTTRVLLTGQSEMSAAISAVNEGQIFRFLTKPCPKETLLATLNDAIEMNRLVTAERELLENTVKGSIRALVDLVGLVHPAAVGQASRLRQGVRELGGALEIDPLWPLEVAAMLSRIGTIAVPAEVAEKLYHARDLSEAEREQAAEIPKIASRIVDRIPRMEPVQDLLTGFAVEASADEALELRVLRLVADFDGLRSEGLRADLAFRQLRNAGTHPPELIDHYETVAEGAGEKTIYELALEQLEVGMTFEDDVFSRTGTLLIARGFEVTEQLLERVGRFQPGWVVEPVQVSKP